MLHALVVTIIIFLSGIGVQSRSTPESPTYRAGVVEFNPSASTQNNLNRYLDIISSPDTVDLDILVFPESCLTTSLADATFVPDEEDAIAPCDRPSSEYDDTIRSVSCAARATQKYIVINLTEKSVCPDRQQIELNDTRPCAEDRINRYNSNVVFDRTGRVISKYRKFNLFGEEGKIAPAQPQSRPFTTDFGVTFGQFICFDLMFDRPAGDLVREGVTDIIFPTMWFSELPFLSATQAQLGWVFENRVNFLAAGANIPPIGSTGTGIYHGRSGALISEMTSKSKTKLYVAEVPKYRSTEIPPTIQPPETESPSEMTDLYLKRDQLDVYTSIPIEAETGSFGEQVCHGEFCCNYRMTYEITKPPYGTFAYKYRLVAFDGVRSFDGVADGGVKVCALIACTNDTLASCGRRFPKSATIFETVKFHRVEIVGNSGVGNVLMMPNSLTTSIVPLQASEFTFEFNPINSGDRYTLTLIEPRSDLYTLALYGRNFDAD